MWKNQYHSILNRCSQFLCESILKKEKKNNLAICVFSIYYNCKCKDFNVCYAFFCCWVNVKYSLLKNLNSDESYLCHWLRLSFSKPIALLSNCQFSCSLVDWFIYSLSKYVPYQALQRAHGGQGKTSKQAIALKHLSYDSNIHNW